MDRDVILKELIEFYFDSFNEDPAGVGDWFAQGDHDFDQFHIEVTKVREDLKGKS